MNDISVSQATTIKRYNAMNKREQGGHDLIRRVVLRIVMELRKVLRIWLFDHKASEGIERR